MIFTNTEEIIMSKRDTNILVHVMQPAGKSSYSVTIREYSFRGFTDKLAKARDIALDSSTILAFMKVHIITGGKVSKGKITKVHTEEGCILPSYVFAYRVISDSEMLATRKKQ
jgi:hypothetical protein